jgi:glucosamine-6-phosphate deaminase
VEVRSDRTALGKAAGAHAARVLVQALAERRIARLMLAAAPSQSVTLKELAGHHEVDFSRVECFHMDEYLGLPPDAPQAFGGWLERHFLAGLNVKAFHGISDRYAAVMGTEPFDLLLCGLGVNGHLAFNDPPARFDDPEPVRVVELDQTSRQQQVDEGHFPAIADVPTHALTVTIPRLLNARTVIASVPGAAKRQAVQDTLNQPIDGRWPGTALRTHSNAHLYVDADSRPRS